MEPTEMDDLLPSSASYPFRAAPLDAPRLAMVREHLSAMEDRYRLFPSRPGVLPLCAVVLCHCAPPDPAADALAVMTHFLYLQMFFIDDVDLARAGANAHDAWALVTRPEQPALGGGDPPGGPALRAASRDGGAALQAAVAARGGDLSVLSYLLGMNLSAFLWRAQPAIGQPADLDSLLELRTQTISAMAYMRAWGLLLGLTAASEVRFAFLLRRIERLSAAVQALANDLRSVPRDERDGTANLVLLQAGAGADRRRACAAARAQHDELLRRLQASIAVARAAAEAAPDLGTYLDFIEICTRGNTTAMDEQRGRYQPSLPTFSA